MSELSRIFTPADQSAACLLAWWRGLDRDRGERAKLRRAASPVEVAYCPSFHRLLADLRAQGFRLGVERAQALAAVAGLAAHVKTHDDGTALAGQLARPKPGAMRARVSGLRFCRLLAISDREELYPMLIRVVRLMDGTVNLLSLANAVFWWNEKTRKEWAYEYYESAPSES